LSANVSTRQDGYGKIQRLWLVVGLFPTRDLPGRPLRTFPVHDQRNLSSVFVLTVRGHEGVGLAVNQSQIPDPSLPDETWTHTTRRALPTAGVFNGHVRHPKPPFYEYRINLNVGS
jgi:hypothetical protein